MKFREQQDDARRATRRLLGLFAVLLVALVLAVNLLLAGLWWMLGSWLSPNLPPFFAETNTIVVLMLVLGGAWVELSRLQSGGGAHVARWAGGQQVIDPRDLRERRLLNVVDEMALASGMPRPGVFVLDDEHAINAFAAGWTPDSAALAVTRGALERLTRDELQGMVAHEFGHIQQGDSRLNMQLLALVWGLSLVHGYGHSLMEGNGERRSPLSTLVGSVFVVAGSLGWLAGQVLQTAVSRQRELMADASAVQFTRSRDGLGGVLRKVWYQTMTSESRLVRMPADRLAAMLLQAPDSWLATHRPLAERVRRLYGRAMEPLPAPKLLDRLEQEPPQETPDASAQADGASTHTQAQAPRAMERRRIERTSAFTTSATPPPTAPPSASAPMHKKETIPYAGPYFEPPSAPPMTEPIVIPQATVKDDERVAMSKLLRVSGMGELRSAILALLITPGSQRERRAWRDENRGSSTAGAVREEVKKLGAPTRLPVLDLLLQQAALAPLHDRKELMEAARRLMAADGQLRPVDRMHWLLMRHRLAERDKAAAKPPANTADAQNDMTQQSLHLLRQVAALTAFLSRMVPDGEPGNGDTWYRLVLNPWLKGHALPTCLPPDADGLVHALHDVQSLPWMLKPVLVRAWLDTALQHKNANALYPEAADALRLACTLLDSPLPPELARHYVEGPAGATA